MAYSVSECGVLLGGIICYNFMTLMYDPTIHRMIILLPFTIPTLILETRFFVACQVGQECTTEYETTLKANA